MYKALVGWHRLFIWTHISAPHLRMSPKHVTEATIALFSASEQTHCTLLWLSDCSFTQHGFEHPPKWLQHCRLVVYMAGATWNCCHLATISVYTIQPCTSLQWHFIQSHIGRVHVHFWQNDWDLLRVTAVTHGHTISELLLGVWGIKQNLNIITTSPHTHTYFL